MPGGCHNILGFDTISKALGCNYAKLNFVIKFTVRVGVASNFVSDMLDLSPCKLGRFVVLSILLQPRKDRCVRFWKSRGSQFWHLPS